MSESTSSCVVELHWQSEESIDLLFVLSICFAIHNDKWTDRYTLQHYNCYFISWAIIFTMRKRVVCTAKLQGNKGMLLVMGLGLELNQNLEGMLTEKLTGEQVLELAWELAPVRVWARAPVEQACELPWELARELERELALELKRELLLARK